MPHHEHEPQPDDHSADWALSLFVALAMIALTRQYIKASHQEAELPPPGVAEQLIFAENKDVQEAITNGRLRESYIVSGSVIYEAVDITGTTQLFVVEPADGDATEEIRKIATHCTPQTVTYYPRPEDHEPITIDRKGTAQNLEIKAEYVEVLCESREPPDQLEKE